MKKKKLIVGILIFMAMMVACIFLNTSNAQGIGELSITRKRVEKGITYKHQLYYDEPNTKNIWKLVKYNEGGTTENLKDLYCLRAGLGFTEEDSDNPQSNIEDRVVDYNLEFPISKKNVVESYNRLVNQYNGVTSETTIFNPANSQNFYAVLWLLDNMLLEDATELEVHKYLTDTKIGAGYTEAEINRAGETTGGELAIRNVLTRADIEAIQQLAIWYFANSDERDYHQDDADGAHLPTIYLAVSGDTFSFPTTDGKTIGFNTEKDTAGRDIYKSLSDIYNLNIAQIPGSIINIGGQWGTQRQSHANTLYRNLIKSAKEAVAKNGGTYTPKRDMTVYLAGTEFAKEQPVIQVKESKGQADIALRKFISAVNGEALPAQDSREPVEEDTKRPDTTYLNVGEGPDRITTATYRHPKKAYPVKLGDTVTYTIRLYNEGDIDACVRQVRDYLPNYLSFTVPEWDKNTEYEWLSSDGGYILDTTKECKVVGAGGKLTMDPAKEPTKIDVSGKKLGEVLIPAAERNEGQTGKDRYTLSYVDIEVYCKVENNAVYDEPITNIAEVYDMRDAVVPESGKPEDDIGRELEDRDSETKNVEPQPGNKDPNPNPKGPLPNYKQEEIDSKDPKKPYIPGQQDDDDFDKIIVNSQKIDLALRKYIYQIGDTKYPTRAPQPDVGPLKKGPGTDANYYHSKDPIDANVGDVVTYRIRVYNEGEVDGKVTEITDYIANNLEYVRYGDDKNTETETRESWWNATKGVEYTTVVSKPNCKIVGAGGKLTVDPAKEPNKIDVSGKTLGDEVTIPKFDKKTGTADDLSYIEVEINCQIMPLEETTKLTNIAEITGEKDENGRPVPEEVEDEDSIPDNVEPKVPDDEDLPHYKEDKEKDPWVPGNEDDDDFEKVKVKVPKLDLALRKFITDVDGKAPEKSRVPVTNSDPLDNLSGTTAEYIHTKKALEVKRKSEVTYTIRLYNEGDINAYVSKVTDYLPEYLDYLPENSINKKFGWEYDENTRQVKTTITAKNNQDGDEVYKDRRNGKLLTAYVSESGDLNYIDVQIVCKVNDKVESNKILTNLAQITETTDETGEKNIDDKDRDSMPDGDKRPGKDFEIPNDEKRPNYKEELEHLPYVPGQEDDDDYEKVVVKDFDLALRKFITGVENTPINNRYPEVKYEDGKISYEHTKDPVEVVTGNTVIYTIRIFNEGQADGWADEITDDMPEGLKFLPEHEINKEYRWIMLDENQEEITDGDTSKAKYIVTDYLSEKQEEETGRKNELKAFDPNKAISDKEPLNPDYKDVKLAFKVTYVAKTKEESARIIKNVAQISKDSDDDIDSEPDRDTPYDPDGPNEDDIDYDNVKVKYFDLSLLKWVAQTKVILNGKEVVTDTGHTAETSKNEPPVKLEIPEKELKNVIIKYVYTIQIENEGEIEGYATEIKDYIPQGLRFDEKDNTEWRWKVNEEGIVTTDYLKDTLLKPGETAQVPIVLTWINSSENLGTKVNLAEISKDKNDSDSPDVDSTPDNKVPDEDDIDDAPVLLLVKTGAVKIYIGMIAIILITFASGISLIKKYVLE